MSHGDGGELVSDDDLATCVRVLQSLASADGAISEAYREPRCKPLRIALQRFLEDASSRQFHGQSPDKYARRKEKKRLAHARVQQERDLDREAADKTRMRSERLRMLSELSDRSGAAAEAAGGVAQLTLVPDGAVETAPPAALLAQADAAADAAADGAADGSLTELRTLHSCYSCKARCSRLPRHHTRLWPQPQPSS